MPITSDQRMEIIRSANGSEAGWWKKGPSEDFSGEHEIRELASEFQTGLKRLPRDRPFSNTRVQNYVKLFEQGQFQMCTWDKAYCLTTKEWYRVNGQHTSFMLLNRVSTIPDWFVVTVRSWECATLKDVANLWATFDNKTQTRGPQDIYMSALSTHERLREIPGRTTSALVGGIGYHLHKHEYANYLPTERVEAVFNYVDFCLWVHSLFPRGTSKQVKGAMLRQPVTAAMFATFEVNREGSDTFWKLVRNKEGVTEDLPQRRLWDYLSTTVLPGGGLGKKEKNVADVREIYVRCIHGWNAWRRGTTTRLTYYPEKPFPRVER
jgi:hypothetical protein